MFLWRRLFCGHPAESLTHTFALYKKRKTIPADISLLSSNSESFCTGIGARDHEHATRERIMQSTLKAIIVDDEPFARYDLLYMLSRHSEIETIGEAGTLD